MKFIKRITTTPLPKHEGKIVDSFDAVSDEKRNAPSINAVKNYVANKINELKSYVDNKFNSYKLKGDFAVISGSHQFDAHTKYYNIPYPNGFTKNNSVAISFEISGAVFKPLNYTLELDSSNIRLLQDEAAVHTAMYKIVLMKV